jgi:signal transduction histidine kinase
MSARKDADFAPEFTGNGLFTGIPDGLREELSGVPEVIAFGPEELVFDEDSLDDHLYLIARGTVRISKRGRGGQQETLTYLEAGDFFGEMAAFDPAPRSARATAVCEAVLGRLDRASLGEMLRAAPLPIVRNLSHRMIRRLRETDRHLIGEMLEAERLSLVGSMASSIIHDLKNPIGIVEGAAEILLEQTTDEDSLRWVTMIRRTTTHMLEMVQELLDYTRGDTSLVLTPVSVGELLDELNDRILRRASESGITVTTRVDYREPLKVDRGRFVRVVVNVLKNAVEAMPKGGALDLAVEEVDGGVCFSITDTGTGIPEHLLPTIFEPFVTHGKPNGTGLGMAIAKAVVDAHHGRITVESTPGSGTRFRITVPRDPEQPSS